MIIEDEFNYDGSILHSRFAYKYLRDKVHPGGDCIVGRGNMDVGIDNMVDLEDVLQHDSIKSKEAINIVWEIPNLDPFGAVCFQRLFNTQICNFINKVLPSPTPFIMIGDDIRINNTGKENIIHGIDTLGKLSVSITYCKDGAALGHTGLNISAGPEAPSFAYSLIDSPTNVIYEIEYIQREIDYIFYDLISDIFVATSKIVHR